MLTMMILTTAVLKRGRNGLKLVIGVIVVGQHRIYYMAINISSFLSVFCLLHFKDKFIARPVNIKLF